MGRRSPFGEARCSQVAVVVLPSSIAALTLGEFFVILCIPPTNTDHMERINRRAVVRARRNFTSVIVEIQLSGVYDLCVGSVVDLM